MPPLPFEPESIEILRLRYRAALARTWDIDLFHAQKAAGLPADSPGAHRLHVFDVRDERGDFRLFVSREHSRRLNATKLHVSASCSHWTGKQIDATEFQRVMLNLIRSIACDEWLNKHASGAMVMERSGVCHLLIDSPPE